MGKRAKIEMEEELPLDPKDAKKIDKVHGKGKKIHKAIVNPLKAKRDAMEIETGKSRIKKAITPAAQFGKRPTKKGHGDFTPTPQNDYKPELYRDFEKLYGASKSEGLNSKNLSKGQKDRLLKKDKLKKKQLFKEFLSKIKDKSKKSALLEMDLMKNLLAGMETDSLKEAQKKEEERHKGVDSRYRNTIANEEVLRTQKILEHPTFLNNPMETVKQHLLNSIELNNKQKN
jgi:hypothetical protein